MSDCDCTKIGYTYEEGYPSGYRESPCSPCEEICQKWHFPVSGFTANCPEGDCPTGEGYSNINGVGGSGWIEGSGKEIPIGVISVTNQSGMKHANYYSSCGATTSHFYWYYIYASIEPIYKIVPGGFGAQTIEKAEPVMKYRVRSMSLIQNDLNQEGTGVHLLIIDENGDFKRLGSGTSSESFDITSGYKFNVSQISGDFPMMVEPDPEEARILSGTSGGRLTDSAYNVLCYGYQSGLASGGNYSSPLVRSQKSVYDALNGYIAFETDSLPTSWRLADLTDLFGSEAVISNTSSPIETHSEGPNGTFDFHYVSGEGVSSQYGSNFKTGDNVLYPYPTTFLGANIDDALYGGGTSIAQDINGVNTYSEGGSFNQKWLCAKFLHGEFTLGKDGCSDGESECTSNPATTWEVLESNSSGVGYGNLEWPLDTDAIGFYIKGSYDGPLSVERLSRCESLKDFYTKKGKELIADKSGALVDLYIKSYRDYFSDEVTASGWSLSDTSGKLVQWLTDPETYYGVSSIDLYKASRCCSGVQSVSTYTDPTGGVHSCGPFQKTISGQKGCSYSKEEVTLLTDNCTGLIEGYASGSLYFQDVSGSSANKTDDWHWKYNWSMFDENGDIIDTENGNTHETGSQYLKNSGWNKTSTTGSGIFCYDLFVATGKTSPTGELVLHYSGDAGTLEDGTVPGTLASLPDNSSIWGTAGKTYIKNLSSASGPREGGRPLVGCCKCIPSGCCEEEALVPPFVGGAGTGTGGCGCYNSHSDCPATYGNKSYFYMADKYGEGMPSQTEFVGEAESAFLNGTQHLLNAGGNIGPRHSALVSSMASQGATDDGPEYSTAAGAANKEHILGAIQLKDENGDTIRKMLCAHIQILHRAQPLCGAEENPQLSVEGRPNEPFGYNPRTMNEEGGDWSYQNVYQSESFYEPRLMFYLRPYVYAGDCSSPNDEIEPVIKINEDGTLSRQLNGVRAYGESCDMPSAATDTSNMATLYDVFGENKTVNNGFSGLLTGADQIGAGLPAGYDPEEGTFCNWKNNLSGNWIDVKFLHNDWMLAAEGCNDKVYPLIDEVSPWATYWGPDRDNPNGGALYEFLRIGNGDGFPDKICKTMKAIHLRYGKELEGNIREGDASTSRTGQLLNIFMNKITFGNQLGWVPSFTTGEVALTNYPSQRSSPLGWLLNPENYYSHGGGNDTITKEEWMSERCCSNESPMNCTKVQRPIGAYGGGSQFIENIDEGDQWGWTFNYQTEDYESVVHPIGYKASGGCAQKRLISGSSSHYGESNFETGYSHTDSETIKFGKGCTGVFDAVVGGELYSRDASENKANLTDDWHWKYEWSMFPEEGNDFIATEEGHTHETGSQYLKNAKFEKTWTEEASGVFSYNVFVKSGESSPAGNILITNNCAAPIEPSSTPVKKAMAFIANGYSSDGVGSWSTSHYPCRYPNESNVSCTVTYTGDGTEEVVTHGDCGDLVIPPVGTAVGVEGGNGPNIVPLGDWYYGLACSEAPNIVGYYIKLNLSSVDPLHEPDSLSASRTGIVTETGKCESLFPRKQIVFYYPAWSHAGLVGWPSSGTLCSSEYQGDAELHPDVMLHSEHGNWSALTTVFGYVTGFEDVDGISLPKVTDETSSNKIYKDSAGEEELFGSDSRGSCYRAIGTTGCYSIKISANGSFTNKTGACDEACS